MLRILVPLALLCMIIGCQRTAVPARQPAPAMVASQPDQVHPSPDGRAFVLYFDEPAEDRVVLVAGGDTTELWSADVKRSVDIEWHSAELARVRLPIGNYNYGIVYAESSSRRVSPMIENAVAVDEAGETVATFDPDAVTLRELWSGREIAAWRPDSLDLLTLWQQCEPRFTLAGQIGMMRFDCGRGEVVREISW